MAVKQRRAKFLLVNLNNSFTKFALSSDARLGKRFQIPTAEVNATSVATVLAEYPVDRVVLGSVVPDKTRVFRKLVKNGLLELSHELDLGIGIDFPNPKTIGADRLANAVAAAHLLGSPSVVVDFGTALTFDILTKGNVYAGGVIAPGLKVMTEYLYQRTALLPQIDLEEPVGVVGKTTRDAMMAGAIYGYRGLIREILSELRKVIAPRSKMVVASTGGYAELISKGLPEIGNVIPQLTLEGLRLVAVRNA